MANAGEGGWWRCGGGLAGGQRSSPEWAALCNQRTSELSFAEPDLSSMQKRVDGDGYGIYFVKFLVSRTGVQAGQVIGLHSLNLMVDCVGCVNGVTQSVPIEITVRIKEASVNFDPPFVTTNPNPIVDVLGIQGAVPASCQQAPIQIYCGRTRFEMGNGGSMYSQDFLRISFKDFDDGTSAQICSGSAKALPQQIKLIQEASTLPTGVRLGTLVAGGSLEGVGNVDYLNPAGAAYVDLTWRPSCENPSDLGLKQFCFTSRDTYYDASLQEDTNFPYLWSPPSLLDTKGFIDTSNPMCPMPQGLRSSCYFVNSQAPKTNILPEFVEPTTSKGRECSAGCCDCCGQENCNCQATLQCCTTLYTTIGRVFTHVVRAVDGPIYASEASEPYFPLRDDHDSYQLEIDFTFPGNIVPAPIVGTMKYGCGATPYAQCTSNPNRKADVLTELVWDLRGLGFSCYKPNANTTSRCTGTDDTSTCNVALGGSSCTKDPVPLPFSVCYRAKELIAPWVNVTLWRRTYKESPVRDSCDVCFILAIADRPVFLEDDDVSPAQGAIFEIPAGREFKIPLTAAAANDAGVVVTSILSDPGAPVGATLGPPRKVLCNEVRAVCELFHQSGYQRYFSFYPSVEHGGQRFEACFRASMEVIKADADLDSQVSEPRCITIKVLQATPSWDGTTPCDGMNGACAPQGHIISTVGCNIAYHLQAVAPLYDLSIQHQDLATCSNCVDGGVAVHSCSETGNKWPCCGNGHCDGAEIGSNCPADCRPDDSSLTLLQTASKSNGYVSRAELKWKPTRGMEGRRLLSCFAATDTLLGTGIVNKDRSASSAPSYCVVVDVERCRYCVPDGSSMVYIAKQYVLNVDWLRLYNTNPGVSDPDGVFPYEKLVIGPTYTVHPGDSLLSIAGIHTSVVIALASTHCCPLALCLSYCALTLLPCRLSSFPSCAGSAKTTLKSILENNPDILDDSYLMEGQKICLLLCSASSA